MKSAILLRAISIMVFPAMLGLVLACATPPPTATALRPADTVAPRFPAATTAASTPPGQIATKAPTNSPPPLPNAAKRPALEPAATAAPTATTLPSPTPEPPVQPTATSAPTAEPTTDHSTIQADIVDFMLPDLNIPTGATVVWTNLDDAGHTATSGKDGISARFDGIGWDSGGLDLDESFSMTFTQPGVFPYTCRFHPWMNAILTVGPSSRETSGGGGSSGSGDGY